MIIARLSIEFSIYNSMTLMHLSVIFQAYYIIYWTNIFMDTWVYIFFDKTFTTFYKTAACRIFVSNLYANRANMMFISLIGLVILLTFNMPCSIVYLGGNYLFITCLIWNFVTMALTAKIDYKKYTDPIRIIEAHTEGEYCRVALDCPETEVIQ